MLDVVIVGGSSAGLSAALILGRSLRDVIVIDDQKPCNRFSGASHGFLTRDGTSPPELLHIAYEQLKR
jgi:thioredoxin reductase